MHHNISLRNGAMPHITPALCLTAKNYNLFEFKMTLITRDAIIIFTLEMPHKPPTANIKTLRKLNKLVTTGDLSPTKKKMPV